MIFTTEFTGNHYFDHMEFSGTTYAQSDECYGYIGFIFGFHSTQKYYVALWRHVHLNYNIYGGIKGVQLRVSVHIYFIRKFRVNISVL